MEKSGDAGALGEGGTGGTGRGRPVQVWEVVSEIQFGVQVEKREHHETANSDIYPNCCMYR